MFISKAAGHRLLTGTNDRIWLHTHKYVIRGGPFHHFGNILLDSKPYRSYYASREADCSQEALTLQWANESLRFMDEYADSIDFQQLRSHPLIWLLRMVCWNRKVCCVPIGELDTFEDFFGIYTIEVSIFITVKYSNLSIFVSRFDNNLL